MSRWARAGGHELVGMGRWAWAGGHEMVKLVYYRGLDNPSSVSFCALLKKMMMLHHEVRLSTLIYI